MFRNIIFFTILAVSTKQIFQREPSILLLLLILLSTPPGPPNPCRHVSLTPFYASIPSLPSSLPNSCLVPTYYINTFKEELQQLVWDFKKQGLYMTGLLRQGIIMADILETLSCVMYDDGVLAKQSSIKATLATILDM